MHRVDFSKGSDLPSVDPEDFRSALRQFASGVTVVTAQHEGEMYGITVSAFSSISLDPPIVMVSINNTSSISSSILSAEHYAVHILSAEQQPVSEAFSSSVPGDEKYDGLKIRRGATGAPIFPGALAVLECALYQTLSLGTHTLMFGRVVQVEAVPTAADPLLYYHQAYRRLAPDGTAGREAPADGESPGMPSGAPEG